MEEKLYTCKGEVEEIIYYNEENGYAIFKVCTEDKHVFTCTGTIYQIYEGVTLKLAGTFINHKVYGKQLKISSYEKIEAEDERGIIKYLSSGLFKGIGEKTAERIVKSFGMDTFDVIDRQHERLSEIKGITKERAENIYLEYLLKKGMQKVVMKLQEYDIAVNIAGRIYEKYKDKAIHIVETNPYLLIDEIEDINFQYADRIAERLDLGIDFHSRVEEGIRHVLKLATLNGHVFMPRNRLMKNVSYILNIHDQDVLDNALYTLEKDKKIFIEKDENRNVDTDTDEDIQNVYLKNFYYAENNIVSRIKQMINLEKETNKDEKEREKRRAKVEKEVNQILKELEIELSDEQYEAVLYAIDKDILLITGGPGTGKTTIIKVITKYFECNERKVSLVAPTGRAAKRITETTQREAMTLHRLLEVTPLSIENEVQRFMRNEDNPIDADVIIVDEMSMVDIMLFNSFLKAVPLGAKLILVGDEKQLPSVGPGNVLRDLVNSDVIKKILLTKIYRQASTSMIITNAHKIRNSEMPELKEKTKDFFFLETRNEEKAVTLIKDLISKRLPEYINCDKSDIQILTPVKRGNVGTQNLNQIVQDAINPITDFSGLSKEIKSGSRLFRINDKVMQIKNNYEIEWKKLNNLGFEYEKGKGVFNGDVGKITSIDTYTDDIVVKFDDDKIVSYSTDMLKELEHAYAITIHKSQGSEYRVVILSIINIPDIMCYKNLLYTGITRAKELLVIVGKSEEIYKMVSNDNEETRYSNLCYKLISNIGKEVDNE